MSDFQIGKSSSTSEIKFATGRTSDFTRMKTKYRDFKQKIEKSDFANSPVAMQEELDMLIQLRKLAEKEKLASESKWIIERENSVKETLTKTKIGLIADAYYPPVLLKGKTPEYTFNPQEQFLELLNSCKNDYGILDPQAERVLLALQEKDADIYHVKNVLAMCKDFDGKYIPDCVEAVVQLANAGVANSKLTDMLSEFTVYDEDLDVDKINFDAIDRVVSLKSEGIDDADAVKFAQYLSGNFSDEEMVKASLLKLQKAGIATDSILKIVDTLSVKNPESGTLDVSAKSINSITTLKKALTSTRKNETNERSNRINLLDVDIYMFGDNTIVTKNGKITYSTPIEGENHEHTKERYAELIASIEDNMLIEFASKYKDKNGEIDGKYVRVASFLRNAGLVYNGLFNTMESCIKEDGSIDTEKIDAIKTIRSAGALSDDVLMLVDACRKDENGKYNSDDIGLVSELTSYVIGGKDVCSLLPVMRDNDDAKDIIMLCAPYVSQNKNLLDLVSMMKTPDGSFGENEMEMLYDLAYSYFSDEYNQDHGNEFNKIAKEIMTISRNDDGMISDDAAGICAIMTRAGESVQTIKAGLMYCFNEDCKVDAKCAQILWDMYIQDSSLPEVSKMINACKSPDGKVDEAKADMIISLFAAKYPKEKIAELVQPKS